MGQYYRPINTTINQYLVSYDYSNGAKLMEHSYVGNSLVNAVCNLLLEGNAWHKCNITWCGDYSESTPEIDNYSKIIEMYVESCKREDPDFETYEINLYNLSEIARFKRVKEDETSTLSNGIEYGFNETKKEYYYLGDIKVVDGWAVHPLPLLLATGNGQGGGDYFNEKGADLIGTWAGDIIFTSQSLPSNIEEYKKIIPTFEP